MAKGGRTGEAKGGGWGDALVELGRHLRELLLRLQLQRGGEGVGALRILGLLGALLLEGVCFVDDRAQHDLARLEGLFQGVKPPQPRVSLRHLCSRDVNGRRARGGVGDHVTDEWVERAGGREVAER